MTLPWVSVRPMGAEWSMENDHDADGAAVLWTFHPRPGTVDPRFVPYKLAYHQQLAFIPMARERLRMPCAAECLPSEIRGLVHVWSRTTNSDWYNGMRRGIGVLEWAEDVSCATMINDTLAWFAKGVAVDPHIGERHLLVLHPDTSVAPELLRRIMLLAYEKDASGKPWSMIKVVLPSGEPIRMLHVEAARTLPPIPTSTTENPFGWHDGLALQTVVDADDLLRRDP